MTSISSTFTQKSTSVSTSASSNLDFIESEFSCPVESYLSCPIPKTTRFNLSMTWVRDENGRLFAYWS